MKGGLWLLLLFSYTLTFSVRFGFDCIQVNIILIIFLVELFNLIC